MTSVLNQVKAFKEMKRKNDNHEQIDFTALSYKYGFDVRGTWQKKVYRTLAKLGK
jgi:hypothetical protein